MTNNFFVFYRAYNPNLLNFQEPITLENADPFFFQNTSSYIYKEYISTLNFTSLYGNRIYPEFNNVSIGLRSNYFVSESIAVLDNSIDLQNSRSLLQQNYDYFLLEYNSSITGSESGSNIIQLNINYFVSESIVVLDNSIDLQNSRSLLQQNYDYFILEYNSSITGSESGSTIIQLNTNYYVSESISTGSIILLETSRSLYLEDLSEFLLE